MAVDEDIGLDRHRLAAGALDRKQTAVDFRRDAFDDDPAACRQTPCSNVGCMRVSRSIVCDVRHGFLVIKQRDREIF